MNSFAQGFNLGPLRSFRGVKEGVENTTYFLTFDSQKTVLQIFEEHKSYEVPFFLDFNKRLFSDGVPTAVPIVNKKEFLFSLLHDKPAVLYPLIPGKTLNSPDKDACYQIGANLAKIHKFSKGYPLSRKNHRWFDWWESKVDVVKTLIPTDQKTILESQIERTKELFRSYKALPKGLIHGDLFKDNALFLENRLSGIIDFYNACEGLFIYDLTIAVNDWCSLNNGKLDVMKTCSLITGYESIRTLTIDEIELWPLVIETAAFRFWMLRLVALWKKKRGGVDAPPHVKDPAPFLKILINRRRDPQTELIKCNETSAKSGLL